MAEQEEEKKNKKKMKYIVSNDHFFQEERQQQGYNEMNGYIVPEKPDPTSLCWKSCDGPYVYSCLAERVAQTSQSICGYMNACVHAYSQDISPTVHYKRKFKQNI